MLKIFFHRSLESFFKQTIGICQQTCFFIDRLGYSAFNSNLKQIQTSWVIKMFLVFFFLWGGEVITFFSASWRGDQKNLSFTNCNFAPPPPTPPVKVICILKGPRPPKLTSLSSYNIRSSIFKNSSRFKTTPISTVS